MLISCTANVISNADDDLYQESCPNITSLVSNRVSKTCSIKGLKRRLPITEWLPKYQKSYFLQDFVAGLSVGLTAIPQGIAYAVVAGLPPQYGLYSSFMGCFVYFFFGSCKDITIGPTAIMSLMIHSAVVNLNVDFALLATFLSGCVILLLGVLNLGFLVQFISAPTITAFITAATITIGCGQIKPLLGITSGSSSEFIQSWENIFNHYDEITFSDTIFGLISLAFLLGMKNLNRVKTYPELFKYLSIARNAIIVIIGIAVAYIFSINGSNPFRLTGDIKKGFPTFGPPPFTTEFNEKTYNFKDMFNALGLSLITIPLVSILESVAIAKAFSKGKVVDATQEMIALGLCNIFSSFAMSMPITGSFTRTAVNNASGVKTPFGGIFTGVIVLIAIRLLTGTFYFIPKTVLAAVIIAAMISMLELHEIVQIYRTRRRDIIPFTATFIVSLLMGMEIGILIGILISIFFTLYNTSRPEMTFDIEKVEDQVVLIVTPDQSLIYSAAEHFKTIIVKKITTEFSEAGLIVINGTSISYIDSTVAKIISSVITDIKLNGKKIFFWNWKKDPFHVMMRHDKKYFEHFAQAETLADLVQHFKLRNEALNEVKAN